MKPIGWYVGRAIRKLTDRTSTKHDSQGDRTPAYRGDIVLDGDEESPVYTFYGNVLKGTHKGDEFYVEVAPGDAVLTSEKTGTVCDTADWGVPAVMFNGKVFGTISDSYSFLKRLACDGWIVSIKARRTGLYMPGIPSIVLLGPDKRFLRHWERACDFFGEFIPYDKAKRSLVVLNIDERHWQGSRPEEGIGTGRIELAYIPWKSKKAKSPMNISFSINGEVIDVFHSTWSNYYPLCEHVGDEVERYGVKLNDSEYGGMFWSVYILFADNA